jgi:isoleucyl-tRNA synthetase
MEEARRICELGHAKRKEEKIKVRQPLAVLKVFGRRGLFEDLLALIKDELNVKKIVFERPQANFSVVFETKITFELREEGQAREIVRIIQDKRKEQKVAFDDKIEVTLPWWPKKFEDYIKKETLAQSLNKGERVSIKRVSG